MLTQITPVSIKRKFLYIKKLYNLGILHSEKYWLALTGTAMVFRTLLPQNSFEAFSQLPF